MTSGIFEQTLKFIGLFILTSTFGISHQTAWGCTADPFWQDTLRCKFFPNDTPPQPPTPPADIGDIKAFTRVDLDGIWPNDGLRCVDGTVPIIYVDEAVNGPSNNWVITMQGGGSCSGAQACLNAYIDPSEIAEMSSAFDPAMKNMEGIHRPILAENTFAAANRIRIKKCGFDRYNGNATVEAVEATIASDVDGDGIQSELINRPALPSFPSFQEGEDLMFDLFHHGRRMLDEVLVLLQDGLTYETWQNIGGQVTAVQATLPPLRDADMILFAGHSAAAHGLMNSIDDLAADMAGWTRSDGTPFEGDTRALFDAHMIPSVESEAAFNEYLDGDLYDQLTLCQAPCESGPPLRYTYDGMAYYSSGGVAVGADVSGYFDGPYLDWQVDLDASCLDAHPGADAWRCADRFHVLFNHITTPFFLREDLLDPNGQHNNNPDGPEYGGHRLFWATPSSDYCQDPAATEPCAPTLSAPDFRARIEEQAERLINDFGSRSELAQAGLTVPTAYLWMPACAEHAGAFDNIQFFDLEIQSSSLALSLSMHDFLVDFMNDVPDGPVTAHIDRDGDRISVCP